MRRGGRLKSDDVRLTWTSHSMISASSRRRTTHLQPPTTPTSPTNGTPPLPKSLFLCLGIVVMASYRWLFSINSTASWNRIFGFRILLILLLLGRFWILLPHRMTERMYTRTAQQWQPRASPSFPIRRAPHPLLPVGSKAHASRLCSSTPAAAATATVVVDRWGVPIKKKPPDEMTANVSPEWNSLAGVRCDYVNHTWSQWF